MLGFGTIVGLVSHSEIPARTWGEAHPAASGESPTRTRRPVAILRLEPGGKKVLRTRRSKRIAELRFLAM